jgi:polysaccharide biosynthesis/export protein
MYPVFTCKSNAMNYTRPIIILILIMLTACTSKKELAYLSNLPETGGEESFTMAIPDYKLQPRDILYITIKAMTPDGFISDFLSVNRGQSNANMIQAESGGYLYGYDINSLGFIELPAIGMIHVAGMTLEETRKVISQEVEKVFKNSTVECKLLSFKFTVIGEVRSPGTYINYNNYLTVLEAIGRAGGLSDFGRRDKILVIRPAEGGTKTFKLNLQDKKILSSEAYFLLPNDVVIVQEDSKKIFNLNLPTFSFMLVTITSTITTTILLLDYLGR